MMLDKLPQAETLKALPVYSVLPELGRCLQEHDAAILKAAPGAGKTTCVPLVLLEEDWLGKKKILMLEPRRLAARGAAERMASLLGEAAGETVGYRVRLESRISDNTRIEVVTEGILTRMLQDDPALEAYGILIFDEFHERHLDADFGLALALQARQMFRQPGDGASELKLLVMSATLDDKALVELLTSGNQPAPVIESEGRQYPVTIHYGQAWKAVGMESG